MGDWLGMGRFSVWCVTVMCAGLGTKWGPLDEVEVRSRRGRSRRPMLNFSETLIMANIGFRFPEHSFLTRTRKRFCFFFLVSVLLKFLSMTKPYINT